MKKVSSFIKKVGSFIKKALGYFCIIECIMAIIATITIEPSDRWAGVLTVIFFGYLAYLCLKKPKTKTIPIDTLETNNTQKSNFEHQAKEQTNDFIQQTTPSVEIANQNISPQVLQSTHSAYTSMQAKNDLMILSDSLELLGKTENLETFFSRYELAMQKISTLEMAVQAGIISSLPTNSNEIMQLRARAEYVLFVSYKKELDAINRLKTTSGKLDRIEKFIKYMENYKDELGFYDGYNTIMNELLSHKQTLSSASIEVAKNVIDEDLEKPDSYIEVGNSIYRTDGEPISDEEVPYLIQLGYEKALRKEGLYNGQMLDLSFMQERDKNKKEFTTIPTYNELSSITQEECPIHLKDILFLEYINGLPLDNPLIAQKWYYDYNLNYSATIKKLIANDLLSVNHACVDKINVTELKSILKSFNLSSTGRKEELIKRIHENLTQEEVDQYFKGAKFFAATEKGKTLIKNKIK